MWTFIENIQKSNSPIFQHYNGPCVPIYNGPYALWNIHRKKAIVHYSNALWKYSYWTFIENIQLSNSPLFKSFHHNGPCIVLNIQQSNSPNNWGFTAFKEFFRILDISSWIHWSIHEFGSTQNQVGFCVSSYFFLFLPMILSWNVLWLVFWIFCFAFIHFYLVHWMGTLENFRKCYWTALLPWQPFTTTTGKHRKMKEESLFDMCMAGVTWFYPYKLHT